MTRLGTPVSGPASEGTSAPAELADRRRRAVAMQAARKSIEAEAADRATSEVEAKARDRGDDDQDTTGSGDAAATDAVPKPTSQRHFTDPDARIMKTADGPYHFTYNCQTVVGADHQVIVATELGNTAVDVQQLIPMIEHTTTTLGAMPRRWSADAGYCSAGNLEHTGGPEAAGDTGYFISTRRVKHGRQVPESPQGRIPKDATVTERMARRLNTKKGKAVYARRKAIVSRSSNRYTAGRASTCCCAGWPRRPRSGS